MAQKSKQWGAIIVMIALFAMIAFVTNLCTPMATIIKNQPGGVPNVLAQIGNYGNFIAYLVMGIPRRYADFQIRLQENGTHRSRHR